MYTEQDLKNIIAICDQDEDAPMQATRLKDRCEKALAYRDCPLRVTKEDKRMLQYYYDKDMDPDAKATLEKVLGGGDGSVLGKKVWISKKSLTKGIYEMEVVEVSNDGKTVYGSCWNETYHGEGRDWHRTKAEAQARARVLQEKKIASLKKQIEKISALDFGGKQPLAENEAMEGEFNQ